jgi:predicted DNA-binding transcriptional regulator AlpA|tara:strand:- start:133 stop:258 length:126 start_codon:yes stop_codon:yes gene_type:complete
MYAMIKAGTFPRPLKIGHGSVACVAWVEADINQWLEDLQAA